MRRTFFFRLGTTGKYSRSSKRSIPGESSFRDLGFVMSMLHHHSPVGVPCVADDATSVRRSPASLLCAPFSCGTPAKF